MILSVHHINKSFVEVPVLKDVTFHLEKGEKAAIVGVNGAGKSPLLKIIIGEETADDGQIAFQKDTTWGYLAQNQNIDTNNTIYEELLTVRQDILDMEAKIALDEKLMTQLSGDELNQVVEEYNELLEKFNQVNGFAYRGEITGVLRGLGFQESEYQQSIATLSGGQKTRVALAKLLLQKPDLIFLDEPTNHLDINSIRWLEGYLYNYRGTVLIVSHDRYFLDKCVGKIIDLENCKATVFPGNYSWYAERKKAMREEAWHHYLSNQAEIKHQEEVITKLRQFNREKSIKRAESREKMLGKMEKLEKPIEMRDDMHLVFRPCIKSGRDVMEVRRLTMAFDQKSLFTDLSFDVKRGDHIAIIGDNGTGKSTLLKLIIGQLQAQDGNIHFGTNVHLGYYDQEHHVLNDSNTVFEEISDAYPDMTNTEIRNLLASFLFTGEDVFKTIRDLSGGEKGRVSLAKLMLSSCNFLILDEPTNHLDMVSKEVLENALNSYEGTVLYVSHDRYFINHTASRILSLTNNLLLSYPGNNADTAPEMYLGNYDFYLEKQPQIEAALMRDEQKRIYEETGLHVGPDLSQYAAGGNAGAGTGNGASNAVSQGGAAISSSSAAAGASSSQGGAADYAKQKEEQARLRKQQNALKKCEDRIAELEDRNTEIDEEMSLPENGTDLPKLAALQKEKSAIEEELEALYEQWEALQA